MADTCDPGPGLFHVLIISKGNGDVTLAVRWSWDGISVWPNCAGPMENVRITNRGTGTWTVRLPSGRLAKRRTITPGFAQYFDGARLAQVGLETIADLSGVSLVPA
jgi:hypothetical protein